MHKTALFAETDLGLELDRSKGAKIGPERPKANFSGPPGSQMNAKMASKMECHAKVRIELSPARELQNGRWRSSGNGRFWLSDF